MHAQTHPENFERRDRIFRALVEAPKNPRRNEEHLASPVIGPVAFWSAAAIVPIALGIGVDLAFGRRAAALTSLGAIAGLGLARWQMGRLFARRTPYVVERCVGELEIRRHRDSVCVEIDVEADSFESALQKGFRPLFRYIEDAGIAMTVPVEIARVDRPDSEVLPEHAIGEPHAFGGRFAVRFHMPDGASMDELPYPADDAVYLRRVAAHRTVAMRFRGRALGPRIAEAQRDLLSSARHALLTVRGEPTVALYDPPLTLPWLRRNEVALKLA
jgi:hypothetical protein